jgi:hypothetical protein
MPKAKAFKMKKTKKQPRLIDLAPITYEILTSESNPIEIDWIPVEGRGALGVTFVPGKCGPAADPRILHRRHLFADAWEVSRHADVLVNMMEVRERADFLIPDLQDVAEACGLQVRLHPIRDLSAPQDKNSYESYGRLASELATMVFSGKRVVVTCRGGKGRAGTIAAAVLMCMGQTADEAIKTVRAHRKGAIETAVQLHFLEQFDNWLLGEPVTYVRPLPRLPVLDLDDGVSSAEFWDRFMQNEENRRAEQDLLNLFDR